MPRAALLAGSVSGCGLPGRRGRGRGGGVELRGGLGGKQARAWRTRQEAPALASAGGCDGNSAGPSLAPSSSAASSAPRGQAFAREANTPSSSRRNW